MQTVNSSLQAIIDAGINANPGDPTRDFTTVVEFYSHDYTPPTDGFDPTDADERFAPISLTWNGLAYRREIISWGEVTRFMGKQINSCSVRFSNVSRYLAAWVVANDVEGMHMVVRLISRSVTTDSIVLYAGRVDKPVEFDRQTAVMSSTQGVTIEQEVPPRTFSPDDPLDRTPDDVLYEGFRFVALQGSFDRVRTEQRRRFLIFVTTKKVHYSDQWSAMDATPYNEGVPEVFGRVQAELVPIAFADIGGAAKGLWVASGSKIQDVINIRNVEDPNRQPNNITVHKGDVGGTGTNATPDQQFPNAGVFSKTAYIGAGIPYGDSESVEDPVTVVAVVVGKILPLPDASGDFTEEGWTHSGPYIVRYLLNNADWGNIAEAFINDPSVISSAGICAEPLVDESQREQVIIPNTDLPVFGTDFRRYRSTGLIDPLRSGYDLGIYDTPIGTVEADPIGYDETDPPTSFATVNYLRERYTTNFVVREKIKLVDLLYDVVLRSFRGYLVINAKGQIEVRVERPADNALLRGNTIVGATQLAVDDVSPWKTGELLLRGKIVVGYPSVTSECRVVSSATYSTAGNSIVLNASVAGSITATKSGAALSGGSTSVAASGTVSIGGTPAAGASVTIEIDGVSIVHTLDAYDTKETIASMLRYRINANETLRRYVVASYNPASPFVVTITSKLGFLNVPALAFTHSIGEEIIRVMMSFSDAPKNADGTVSNELKQAGLTRNNITANTFKWPLGGKQSSINRIEINYNEATDDFAKTRLFVNDLDHQEQIRKKNVLKIDGSAIDNYHQASRIANAALSKNREGDWFASWQTTDPNGMLLEEGDVVCVSDDSGGLVNQVLRVEEVRISSERVVSITGRRYSTNMFSDTVTAQVIPLPTTLRYTKPADTQFVPMDLPYWRDSDPIYTPGFHVPTNRALAAGDWMSTRIYSDATGAYVPMAERASFRVPMGVALTTLSPTTNTHTLDTVSTVRVQITTFGESDAIYQLQSTTDEKFGNGANRYAIGVNGRWEIGQFQTATLVGGTTDTFDLTIHKRGQFGTELHTSDHDIDDKFVLLTDADGNDTGVAFVQTDINLLNHTFNLKAVTTNQDIADATPQSFTWEGLVIRHKPVRSLRAFRNVVGDILPEWMSGGLYFQGVREGLTNPTGAEKEKYLVRLMDGVDEKHRFTVEVGKTPIPMFWRKVAGDKFGTDIVLDADGSIDISFQGSTVMMAAESMQTFKGEALITFSPPVDDSTSNPADIGIMPEGSDAAMASLTTSFVQALTAFPSMTYTPDDEFTLWIKDGTARWYKNFSGENSKYFHLSTAAIGDVRYKVVVRGKAIAFLEGGYNDCRILRHDPEVLITSALQTELYGGLKGVGELEVIVQQLSELGGAGIPVARSL